MKRIVSFAMALVMGFSITAESFAADYSAVEKAPAAENTSLASDVSVEGTNSFGEMIAEALTEQQTEQQENNGFNIFSIDIENNVAAVELEALEDCSLVVAVYDDAGTALLSTKSMDVPEGDTTVSLTFEEGELPQYFYLRGFLADPATLRPKCTVYESPMYTQEMQEFLAKTTDDFDEELVLNLDDSTDNNFAVFSESTKQLEVSDTANVLQSFDEVTATYVFENCDDSFTTLAAGDVFAFWDDNSVVIEKVGEVDVDGTTVTIVCDSAELEEAFDYVKIDESQDVGAAVVDDSNMSPNLQYNGMITPSPKARAFEYEGSLGTSLNFTLSGVSVGDLEANGNLGFAVEASVKVYVSIKHTYMEVGMEYGLEFGIEFSASSDYESEWELPSLTIPVCVGINVAFAPKLCAEVSGSVTIGGELKGNVGFRFDSQAAQKFTSLTSSPTFSPNMEIKAEVFLGLALEPRIEIVSDKLAMAGFEAKVGFLAEATLNSDDQEYEDGTRHACKSCINGDISAVASLSVEAKLFDSDKLKFEYTFLELKIHLLDFYYSASYNSLGFTKCPYKEIQIIISASDESGNKLNGFDYNIYTGSGEYLEAGNSVFGEPVAIYMNEESYQIKFFKDGYSTETVNFTVKETPGIVKATLKKISEETAEAGSEGDEESLFDDDWGTASPTIDGSWINNDGSCKIRQVSLGYYHSAAITENGDLYTWGRNYAGQLGNGTKDNSDIPVKIMSNIKAVSLGSGHSAAITENGDLYTWGENYYGQLGSGNTANSATPKYIMSNVKAVSLGVSHSAAITENGDLYTWGLNWYGQLGHGYKGGYETTPTKIMSNVKAVSLGNDTSAAVTEDGELYSWGYEYIGDGTTEGTSTPRLIMSNVNDIELGTDYSAIILKNGDLYAWGYGGYGGIGNGTSDDYLTPVKISSNVKAVNIGYEHGSFISVNGDLYTWGINYDGQLGDGSRENCATPKKIMSNVQSVSLGYDHSAAITENGKLYIWGDDFYGKLGIGDGSGVFSTPIYLQIYDTNLSEISDSALSSSEGEIPSKTISYENLTPETAHNFYVLKSNTAEDILAPENILFINQEDSDTEGRLSMTFTPVEDFAGAFVYLKSIEPMAITDTTIADYTVYYNGSDYLSEHLITYNGKPLRMGRDYTISGDIMESAAGTYTILIDGIGDFSGTAEAVWTILAIESAAVTALPSKTVYQAGESLDLTGAVLTVTYADSTTQDFEITADMVSGFDSNKGGKQTLTVTYCGATAAFDVTVIADKPSVTATAGNGQVTLCWNALDGATKYAVYSYLNGSYSAVGVTTKTTYTVNNLINGTNYGFLVRAYVNGVWTGFTTSDNVYCTPALSEAKPVVSAAPLNNSVQLTWETLDGATKYAVYSYLDGKYSAVGVTTETSYTVNNLTNGTEYGFLVRACINGVWTSFTISDNVYCTPAAPEAKPEITTTAKDSRVELTWEALDGATKYAVYSYLDGKYSAVGTTTQTSYIVNNLENGTEYGFLVRAYVNGSWTGFTTDDNVYCTPMADMKPEVKATAKNGRVQLTWEPLNGATKYGVYSYLGGKYTAIGVTAETSCTVNNLQNGTEYGFLVRAYVNGNWTLFTADDNVYCTPEALTKPEVTVTAQNGSVQLAWEAPEGATKYAVYSYLNGSYTAVGTTTGITYTVKNLTNGTRYGFLVRAYVDGTWTGFTAADNVYCTPLA